MNRHVLSQIAPSPNLDPTELGSIEGKVLRKGTQHRPWTNFAAFPNVHGAKQLGMATDFAAIANGDATFDNRIGPNRDVRPKLRLGINNCRRMNGHAGEIGHQDGKRTTGILSLRDDCTQKRALAGLPFQSRDQCHTPI